MLLLIFTHLLFLLIGLLVGAKLGVYALKVAVMHKLDELDQ